MVIKKISAYYLASVVAAVVLVAPNTANATDSAPPAHQIKKVSESKSYPPYPNVWLRMVPRNEKGEVPSLSVYSLDNGDFFIQYIYSVINNDHGEEFFSGTSHVLRRRFVGGELVPQRLFGKDVLNLPNGIRITPKSLDPRLPQRCPQILNNYYLIEYPDGHKERKSLLYLLDKPKTEQVQELCASTNEQTIKEKVVTMYGWLYPLDDRGFLLVEPLEGVVIRFDGAFHTKANILGKRLFIVDTEKLEALKVDRFEAMGYEDEPYQKAHDRVLKFVKSLK